MNLDLCTLSPRSTLMRRVPDPESSRWNHMSLLLHPGGASAPGIWMEDYKFLAAYKLKASVRIDTRITQCGQIVIM